MAAADVRAFADGKTFYDIPLASEDENNKDRFFRLHLAPENGPVGSSHGTVVIIHGGYWKNKFGLDDEYGNAGTASLAPFFVQRGFTAVELEYRRRDHEGGGWPGTNEDIAASLVILAELHQKGYPGNDDELEKATKALRPDRLVLIGHSAGGCLALWAAHALAEKDSRNYSSSTACNPIDSSYFGSRYLTVALVLAVAPVADLVRGHELRISDEGDAVELYMKCKPDSESNIAEYQKASPAALLPLPVPVIVAIGDADADVPPELCAGYVEMVRASNPPETSAREILTSVVISGADHFDVVNAGSAAWNESIVPALATVIGQVLDADAAAALTQGK